MVEAAGQARQGPAPAWLAGRLVTSRPPVAPTTNSISGRSQRQNYPAAAGA